MATDLHEHCPYSGGMPRADTGPPPADATFATWLRAAREQAGWTKGRAVDALEALEPKIAARTYMRYESGETEPSGKDIRRICDTLKLDRRRAAIALGIVSDDELGLPAEEPLDPLAMRINGALRDQATSDDAKELLRQQLSNVLDLWVRALNMTAPREARVIVRRSKAPRASDSRRPS